MMLTSDVIAQPILAMVTRSSLGSGKMSTCFEWKQVPPVPQSESVVHDVAVFLHLPTRCRRAYQSRTSFCNPGAGGRIEKSPCLKAATVPGGTCGERT